MKSKGDDRPDFSEAAVKYHNETMMKSDVSGLPYGHFFAGANHGYTLCEDFEK